jgi:hypothetical protein
MALRRELLERELKKLGLCRAEQPARAAMAGDDAPHTPRPEHPGDR